MCLPTISQQVPRRGGRDAFKCTVLFLEATVVTLACPAAAVLSAAVSLERVDTIRTKKAWAAARPQGVGLPVPAILNIEILRV